MVCNHSQMLSMTHSGSAGLKAQPLPHWRHEVCVHVCVKAKPCCKEERLISWKQEDHYFIQQGSFSLRHSPFLQGGLQLQQERPGSLTQRQGSWSLCQRQEASWCVSQDRLQDRCRLVALQEFITDRKKSAACQDRVSWQQLVEGTQSEGREESEGSAELLHGLPQGAAGQQETQQGYITITTVDRFNTYRLSLAACNN